MKKESYSLKQILTSNGNWYRFYEDNSPRIRESILVAITKLLSCRTTVRGYHQYRCENSACPHVKRVAHTCKSKACSSCGKKATEVWIKQQNGILPQTQWQHITFTMPSQLWDFFWTNRELLNLIGKIAAHAVLSFAKTKGVIPAIFIAIHTFSHDLERNVHIHLSTTRGGITFDFTQWKRLFFNQATLMKIWRYEIIQLFRKHYQKKQLVIPPAIQKNINHTNTFNSFLNQLYKKHWLVHCSKASEDYQYILNYLGRYVKRPAIAQSKLRHYDGNTVTFDYLDRTHKKNTRLQLSVNDFIGRFIQHIPDAHFRMIRYYGVLSHRLRGELLPKVYQLLGQQKPPDDNTPKNSEFATLMEKDFGVNPLICILCGGKLLLEFVFYGKSSVSELLQIHRQLALTKKI